MSTHLSNQFHNLLPSLLLRYVLWGSRCERGLRIRSWLLKLGDNLRNNLLLLEESRHVDGVEGGTLGF